MQNHFGLGDKLVGLLGPIAVDSSRRSFIFNGHESRQGSRDLSDFGAKKAAEANKSRQDVLAAVGFAEVSTGVGNSTASSAASSTNNTLFHFTL